MEGWAPGTQHYTTSDGRVLAVMVDESLLQYLPIVQKTIAEFTGSTVPDGNHTIVIQPSTVIECDAAGGASELTPVFTADPGTSYEETLRQYGYAIGASE